MPPLTRRRSERLSPLTLWLRHRRDSCRGRVRPLSLLLALAACAHGASSKTATAPDWQPWSKETFEKAKAENRYLLVDCSAEWCHWCLSLIHI